MKFTKEQIDKFGLDTTFLPSPMLVNKLNAFVSSREEVMSLSDSEFVTMLNNSPEQGKKRINWNGVYLLLRSKSKTLVKEKFRGLNG